MDIKLPLALVLIAGGTLGAFWPSADDDRLNRTYDRPPASFAEDEFTPQSRLAVAQQDSTAGWATETILQRESDGHFYANVRVDGHSYRMLVDTGASVVALTEGDAMAMGMTWFDEDVAPVAQGAGGPVEGIRTSINRMSLGDHEASGVSAIIIPDGAGVSLLGQSFLSTIKTVEINGDKMVLSN